MEAIIRKCILQNNGQRIGNHMKLALGMGIVHMLYAKFSFVCCAITITVVKESSSNGENITQRINHDGYNIMCPTFSV